MSSIKSEFQNNKQIESLEDNFSASKLQLTAAFISLLGALSIGSSLSFTSPALPSMLNELETIHVEDNLIEKKFLNQEDQEIISWIISIINIGGLVGSLVASTLTDYLGYRLFFSLINILNVVAWIMIFLAPSSFYVVIGRSLNGLFCGLVCSSVPIYVLEIATLKARGFFGCSFQGMISIGIFLTSLLGAFVDWRLLALISSIPSIFSSIFMPMMPENPYWLIRKNRLLDAQSTFKLLRSKTSNYILEFNFLLKEQQLENSIKNQIQNQNSIKSIEKKDLNQTSQNTSFVAGLKTATVYKPLILGLILMFYQQICGSAGLISNLESIINAAKLTKIDAHTASSLINFCFIAAAWSSTILVNMFGRRTLLIFSSAGYFVSYILLFIFFLDQKINYFNLVNYLPVIPLVALILYFIVHAIGFGGVCWLIIPEMCVNQYKTQILALSSAMNWIISFVVMKNFNLSCELFGFYKTFLIFSTISITSGLFVYVFVPETRKKNSTQIHNFFNKK